MPIPPPLLDKAPVEMKIGELTLRIDMSAGSVQETNIVAGPSEISVEEIRVAMIEE
jgi:hypothetical protein